MKTLIVIPARYNSTRFPGKPLAKIHGIPMIERVYRLAVNALPDSRVIVATDDNRISEFVQSFSGEAIITSEKFRNGTERVAAVLDLIDEKYDFIINFQGDAVLTPPWVIRALVNVAFDSTVELVTAATQFTQDSYSEFVTSKKSGEVGGTTVVFNKKYEALYFSKSIIPFIREPASQIPVWRHIGIYGYRPEVLKRLVSYSAGPLEAAEQLEQLRALENGINIRVAPVDYLGRTHWGIDSYDDLVYCEKLIISEGELINSFMDK